MNDIVNGTPLSTQPSNNNDDGLKYHTQPGYTQQQSNIPTDEMTPPSNPHQFLLVLVIYMCYLICFVLIYKLLLYTVHLYESLWLELFEPANPLPPPPSLYPLSSPLSPLLLSLPENVVANNYEDVFMF